MITGLKMIHSNNRGQNSRYKKKSVRAIDKTNLLQKKYIYTYRQRKRGHTDFQIHTYTSVGSSGTHFGLSFDTTAKTVTC